MKRPTPTLRTARFVLRDITRADGPALFPAFADAELMRWWSRGPFVSQAELEDWLAPAAGWAEGRSWAIADSDDGPAIGRIVAIDRGDAVSEVGYLVVAARQGQGIAREALSAMIEHLFSADEQRRVMADVDPDNKASNRLLETLGFTLEGRLREHWTTHIGRRDSFIWGMLADEWQNRTAPISNPLDLPGDPP